MKNAIEAELKEAGLQTIPHSVTKVMQLYETMTSRHSIMIVGKTQSGKTVSWRTLQATLSRLNREGDNNFQQVKVGLAIGTSWIFSYDWKHWILYANCISHIFAFL